MKPGQHEPDVHAVRALLRPQRVRPAGERELRGAVGAGARARDAAGGRGDVDDRARRGRAQQRQQRLGQAHLRVEVDRHRAPDVLIAAVGERRAPGGAGVVDEQVQAAVALGTCSRMRAGASSSTRSTATQLTRCSPSDGASARRRSSRRATSTSAAPGSRASRRAVASPIPLEAPVMSITSGCRRVVVVLTGTAVRGASRVGVRPVTRCGLGLGPAACQIGRSHERQRTQRARGSRSSRGGRRRGAAPGAQTRASARRSSCSAACRAATTSCRRRSASGRTRAGAARWSTRWRRAAAQRVLDVATGTGMVAAELLARSGCSVVGHRPERRDARRRARARFRERHGARVELVEGQAEELPFADASFDALTFTYLLRYVDDPRGDAARAGARVRPGGRVASLEFGVPPWRARARGVAPLHGGRAAARSGALASREWARGRALPRAEHPRLLRAPSAASGSSATGSEAGLEDVRVRRMSFGGGVVMSARKAGRLMRRARPPARRRGEAAPAG